MQAKTMTLPLQTLVAVSLAAILIIVSNPIECIHCAPATETPRQDEAPQFKDRDTLGADSSPKVSGFGFRETEEINHNALTLQDNEEFFRNLNINIAQDKIIVSLPRYFERKKTNAEPTTTTAKTPVEVIESTSQAPPQPTTTLPPLTTTTTAPQIIVPKGTGEKTTEVETLASFHELKDLSLADETISRYDAEGVETERDCALYAAKTNQNLTTWDWCKKKCSVKFTEYLAASKRGFFYTLYTGQGKGMGHYDVHDHDLESTRDREVVANWIETMKCHMILKLTHNYGLIEYKCKEYMPYVCGKMFFRRRNKPPIGDLV